MKQTRPIIFFDTEFTHLDPKKGELLSLGLVKETGEELYIEFPQPAKDTMHPWVIEHVLPYLSGESISREEAREKINSFFGSEKPYVMAYVNQFDAMYWYELFGDPQKHPAFWIPLDFASILFAHGFDPESMRQDAFFERIGIKLSDYKRHNALDDAKLLKEVYSRFLSYIGK